MKYLHPVILITASVGYTTLVAVAAPTSTTAPTSIPVVSVSEGSQTLARRSPTRGISALFKQQQGAGSQAETEPEFRPGTPSYLKGDESRPASTEDEHESWRKYRALKITDGRAQLLDPGHELVNQMNTMNSDKAKKHFKHNIDKYRAPELAGQKPYEPKPNRVGKFFRKLRPGQAHDAAIVGTEEEGMSDAARVERQSGKRKV